MNKLKDFIQTDVFKDYAAKNDIIHVMLVGSRAFGVVDERSDYDISIYCKRADWKHHTTYKNHYLIHEDGSRLHWYLEDPDSIQEQYDFLVWALSMYSHSEDQVIVYNKKAYNKLKDQRRELLIEAYKKEVNNPNSFISQLKNKKEFEPQNHSKHIYRYLLGWYLIRDGQITEEQKQWLKELKRIRWQSVDTKKLQTTLIELQEALEFLEVK